MPSFSIRELVVDGHLGGVRPSMARHEVSMLLGAPDDWSRGRREDGSDAPIWRYGNFEIHFADDQSVAMVFTDYVLDSDAGSIRALDAWMLDGTPLTLATAMERLEREGVAFREDRDLLGRPRLSIDGSGAELTFDVAGQTTELAFIAVRAS